LLTIVTIVVALGGLVLLFDYMNRPFPTHIPPTPPSPSPLPDGPGLRPDGGKEGKDTSEELVVTPPQPSPRTKPKPKIQPPARPSPDTESIAPSRAQLERLLEEFRTAYDRQDLSILERLSEISPDRQLFLDMMSSNYSSIRTTIRVVEVTSDHATATLIHQKLIDRNSESVDPDQILRSIQLKVKKEGDHWGKVVW
jgi:hypothetical protein